MKLSLLYKKYWYMYIHCFWKCEIFKPHNSNAILFKLTHSFICYQAAICISHSIYKNKIWNKIVNVWRNFSIVLTLALWTWYSWLTQIGILLHAYSVGDIVYNSYFYHFVNHCQELDFRLFGWVSWISKISTINLKFK